MRPILLFLAACSSVPSPQAVPVDASADVTTPLAAEHETQQPGKREPAAVAPWEPIDKGDPAAREERLER